MSKVADKKPKKTGKKEKSLQKEKIKQDKEILSKHYTGTNIRKLPKVPKAYLKDLEAIEPITTEQLESYLTAMLLGVIPDRFGLEVTADTKMKAAKSLMDLREIKLREQSMQTEEDLSNIAIEFVVKQKKQVDDDSVEADESNEDDTYGSNWV